MITIHVHDGIASKPDNCTNTGAYDPPVGEVIKFIAEDGNEYRIVTCGLHGISCCDCVFNSHSGHPLSKLFNGECGSNITRLRCYDRVYKPIDTILEEL